MSTKADIEEKILAAAEHGGQTQVGAGDDARTQRQVQPINDNSLRSANFADAIIVSLSGGATTAAATLVATAAYRLFTIAAGVQPPVPSLDCSDIALAGGVIGALIYFINFYCPVWLGSLLFAAQLLSGVVVGKVATDVLSIWCGPVPAWISIPCTVLLTFVFGILPTFMRPLYEACCLSTLENTLAHHLFDFKITDRNGKTLGFRKAWKRSLLSCIMYPAADLSQALGKDYKSADDWLNDVSGTMKMKKGRTQSQELTISKNTLLVRYRAFHEMEIAFKLDKRKYAARNLSKADKSFERGRAFVRFLKTVFAWTFIASFLRMPAGIEATTYGLAAPSSNDFLLWGGLAAAIYFLLEKCGLIAFLIGVLYGLFVTCRPTHVEISKKGVRIVGNLMPWWIRDPVLTWDKVKRIGLELPRGKSSVADHWLVFYAKDGTRRRLRVGSIDTTTAREEILKAIERWAPGIPRDVEVIKALQAPCDYSYTDLWLEALSSPPKRDRLEPLIEGAQLKSNQYNVISMLGCGGQGTAYLASDLLTGERIVLKEFMLPVFVDVNVRRKALGVFEQEARLLKELSHPQVVKLVDYFVEDHRAYLVLEHIDGMSLSQKVKQDGPLNEQDVIRLCLQMCDILQYLASRSTPIVHRDFTPDNLILNSNGTLKLIDFNVAHQDAVDGTTGTVVGKTAYMPPEQFRGQPVLQSDIYAMGATVYYLLVGQEPVPITSSDPVGAGADVSPELNLIVQKLTQPDLKNRFKNIAEVRQMLEAAIKLTPEEELARAVEIEMAKFAEAQPDEDVPLEEHTLTVTPVLVPADD